MSEPTPVQPQKLTPGQEIQNLFAQKGELITQIEIAQNKLNQVNQRLGAILNAGQPQPSPA